MDNKISAQNPYMQGLRVVDKDDLFPQGFTKDELDSSYIALTNSRHDFDMLLESASFEEVDNYYNPADEKISDTLILEAITIDRFSRTEKRMSAVVRTFNKHLSANEIEALAPIVGDPKKTGGFAYVTVQLPFSDGQVVSVIFHSPEGDKKKITSSDTLIAFQWILNKRDITHLVAPEESKEVSLETVAKRITQIVVKNSKRFVKTQKEAIEETKKLQELQESLANLENNHFETMNSIEEGLKEEKLLSAKLSNIQALLDKKKAHNEELRAILAGLDGVENSTNNNANIKDTVFGEAHHEFSGKPNEAIEHLLTVKKGYVPAAITREGIGAIDIPYGKTGKNGYGLAHIIERRNNQGFNGEEFVKRLPQILKNGRIKKDEKSTDRVYVVSNENDSEAVIRLTWDGKERAWLLTSYLYNKKSPETLGEGQTYTQTYGDEQHISSSRSEDVKNTINMNEPNVKLNTLKEILAGTHDALGIQKIGDLLDTTYEALEKDGISPEIEALLNEAVDYLTQLTKLEVEKVV